MLAIFSNVCSVYIKALSEGLSSTGRFSARSGAIRLSTFIWTILVNKVDMADSIEIDFLGVETAKSGDAISVRYELNGRTRIHVVDGGYLDTGDRLVEHIATHYGTSKVDSVILTHPDRDHANGLRKVLEHCEVGELWMHRPWIYASELLPQFETYNSVDALRSRLRKLYPGPAALEEIALEKGIPIRDPFQGAYIGDFLVLAPTRARYLDLVVASDRTPEAADDRSLVEASLEVLTSIAKAGKNLIKGLWGQEFFPASGTSEENEMSVVQTIVVKGKRVLLTGDTGRDGLTEAADYLEQMGGTLPGVWGFQVPHHGGRHNVNTEVLNRWLGEPLKTEEVGYKFVAACSSAKADEDHPRKVVVRAMIHRGAHFVATKGRDIMISQGCSRENWSAVEQTPYPLDYERD